MTNDDHDPFNESTHRSNQSGKLMKEEFFWNCVDEECPFGSDEGWEAYYSYRDWRSENPKNRIVDYMDEIMLERSDEYNDDLTADDVILQSVNKPQTAFLGDEYDPQVLDETVIAICLGQLIDEGKIDLSLRPFARVAIERQRHKAFNPSRHRLDILRACARVIHDAQPLQEKGM